MTTTANWLATKDGVRLALSCILEGINGIWTSTSTQTTGTGSIQAAYASTDWSGSPVYTGLHLVGEFGQKTELFSSKIDKPNLTVRIQDDSSLAAALLKFHSLPASETTLTASTTASGGTWTVATTAGFPSSGTADIYCGLETATTNYATKTGTTLSMTQRGRFSIFGTNTDASHFGHYHQIGGDQDGSRPTVSTVSPVGFYNRQIAIYVHHYENGGWSVKGDSHFLFAGRIKNVRDSGDGTFELDCTLITEELSKPVFAEQFRGTLKQGVYLQTADCGMEVSYIRVQNSGGTGTIVGQGGPTTIDLSALAGAIRSADDVLQEINNQLDDLENSGATWYNTAAGNWKLERQERKVIFRIVFSGLAANESLSAKIGLGHRIWELLGFGPAGGIKEDDNGRTIQLLEATIGFGDTGTTAEAEELPMQYMVAADTDYSPGRLYIENQQGSFAAQPTFPLTIDADADGFLMVGDRILAVSKIDATTYEYKWRIDPLLYGLGRQDDGGDYPIWIRESETSDPLEVKQIWFETGLAANLLLKLMASTGTSGYNHANYDVYGEGIGLALPWTAIDDVSMFAELFVPYVLLLDRPTPFDKLLASACQLTGSHCVWKNGKITMIPWGSEGAASESIATLTEANKATSSRSRSADRTTMEINPDGIINSITLKYQKQFDGSFDRTLTVNNAASRSDFKASRGLVIEGHGCYEGLGMWPYGTVKFFEDLAARALSRFSRPYAVVSRTYDLSLATKLIPGARVDLTDNYIVDTADGARGVANRPCWVLGATFDWATGVGHCELAFAQASVLRPWGPSALVSSYATTTATVTCAAHEYSNSADAADASYFVATYKCRLVEFSPANPASPTVYADLTVSSQAGNNVVLSNDPTAGAGLTGTYVLEYEDGITCVAAQRSYAFIADDADDSDGIDTPHYSLYGGHPGNVLSSIDYTVPYKKYRNTDDDKGEPLSVHKVHDIHDFLSCALAYHTAPQMLGQQLISSSYINMVGTTRTLIYGPIYIPLTGWKQTIKVTICGYVGAGTGTFRVTLSNGPVKGSSYTSYSYPDGGAKYVEVSTASTTVAYLTETEITQPHRLPDSPLYAAWLTIEGVNSGAANTTTLCGVFVRETNLS